MRWIVFDDDTADFVTGKYKRGGAEVRYDELPLDAALRSKGASVLLLPSVDVGRVLVARIERNTQPPVDSSLRPDQPAVLAQSTPLRTIAAQKFQPRGPA